MSHRKHIAEFIRMPKTVEMAIADLQFDETRPKDEQFIALYKKYLTGKLKDIRTRVDIEKAIPGFFQITEQGSYENVGLRYDERYLDSEVSCIRQGFRPSIFLYKAFVGPGKNNLICSDDLLSFHAYKKLGIRYIPAVTLGKHLECLSESGICTRGDPKAGSVTFDSLMVHKHDRLPSIANDLDITEQQDFASVIRTLIRSVGSTKGAICLPSGVR
jgi:hypothetical protein